MAAPRPGVKPSAEWRVELPAAHEANASDVDAEVEHDHEEPAPQVIHRSAERVFRAAEGNQKDSGVVQRAQAMIDAKQAKDMEDALNKLYESTKGPERNKVKATQKAFGFRGSRANRE